MKISIDSVKDFDINIKGSGKVTLRGEDTDLVKISDPDAKVDNDWNSIDIDSKTDSDIEIILPKYLVNKIELSCKVDVVIDNIKVDSFEIDSNESIKIDINKFEGSLEINQLGCNSVLYVPSDFMFRKNCEGKGNTIIYDSITHDDSSNRIELNGRDSSLTIVKKL